jgi:hypothetical protein
MLNYFYGLFYNGVRLLNAGITGGALTAKFVVYFTTLSVFPIIQRR